MQLALSLDTCVPLAPQHDFPPAKDVLAANIPAATNAKVVLIMHLRQHELRNVQCVASVIPSRGDDEGPRLRSDDAHCKRPGVHRSYVRGFAAGSLRLSSGMTTST